MKINIKKLLGILSIIIILVLLFFLLKNNQQDIVRLKEISPVYILILIILTILEFIINGIMLVVILEPFNLRLKLKEWLGLSIITTFGNYLTFFRGGTSAKAIYLKKEHDLSYHNFIASSGASYIITILMIGIVGVALSAIMFFTKGLFNSLLFMVFLAIFLASLLLIVYTPKARETNSMIISHFYQVLSGWHSLRKNKRFILHFFLISFLLYLVSIAKIFLLYKSLSYDISFIAAAYISLTSGISFIVNITPAGLGVREAILAITSGLLGIGLKSGIYVATLDRVITIVLVSIIGPIFSYALIKKTTQTSQI